MQKFCELLLGQGEHVIDALGAVTIRCKTLKLEVVLLQVPSTLVVSIQLLFGQLIDKARIKIPHKNWSVHALGPHVFGTKRTEHAGFFMLLGSQISAEVQLDEFVLRVVNFDLQLERLRVLLHKIRVHIC